MRFPMGPDFRDTLYNQQDCRRDISQPGNP